MNRTSHEVPYVVNFSRVTLPVTAGLRINQPHYESKHCALTWTSPKHLPVSQTPSRVHLYPIQAVPFPTSRGMMYGPWHGATVVYIRPLLPEVLDRLSTKVARTGDERGAVSVRFSCGGTPREAVSGRSSGHRAVDRAGGGVEGAVVGTLSPAGWDMAQTFVLQQCGLKRPSRQFCQKYQVGARQSL